LFTAALVAAARAEGDWPGSSEATPTRLRLALADLKRTEEKFRRTQLFQPLAP
jgi:hypothetical protein